MRRSPWTKTFLLVLASLAPLTAASAQEAGDNQVRDIRLRETGVWNGLYIKVRATERFGYYGEHHLRLRNSPDNVRDFAGQTRQVYNRAGLNIFVNDYFEVVVGPTLVFNYTPEPGNPEFERVTVEPRIWHQWLFTMPLGRAKVNHQFRFEHRWKRPNDVGAQHDYTDRFRYKFFAYVPLNTQTIQKGTWFVSPSAEIFLQSGQSIVNNPMEDFRTYNGIGYVMSQRVSFFVGHMWTLGQRPTGNEYGTSHILRFNAMVGFDLRDLADRLPPIHLGF